MQWHSGSSPNESNVLNCGNGRVIPACGEPNPWLSIALKRRRYDQHRQIPAMTTTPKRHVKVAAVSHPGDGRMVFVCQDVDGFYEKQAIGELPDDMTAEQWNVDHGVTEGMAQALMAGSMCGWGIPQADPDFWNADGTPKMYQ